MNKWILSLLTAFQFAAAADLASDFNALNNVSKGPFSLNYLQGPSKRTTIKSGKYPSKVLFQAAFRNDTARVLSENHEFYVGNLFTTNYYELLGEFGFSDAYGSHPLEHEKLYSNSDAAMVKATKMARHWVLEKHYIHELTNSKISRAFQLRGISGAEFETEYARYFFEFYLSSMTDDFQYLIASLLVQDSPVVDSSGLKSARNVIAKVYDDYAAKYGSRNATIRRIYKIRNAIHNQISPEAIKMIDALLADNPQLKGDKRFRQVRNHLVTYFSFSVDNIIEMAKELELKGFEESAASVNSSKSSPDSLLNLSRILAQLKTDLIYNKSIPKEKMASTLALIAKTNGFLNRELSEGKFLGSKAYIEALCNVIYSEGFLIKDNWEYYIQSINSADESMAKSLLAEIISVTADTLFYAFEPALDQWISVEPKMSGFSDNVIKSSAINAAAKNL